jgi:hypothetical protein
VFSNGRVEGSVVKRIAWILGWATPEKWFAEIAQTEAPAWSHHFFEAAPNAVEDVTRAGAFDLIGGYSLGALLLLAAKPSAPAVLLAPIFGFPQEAGKGGRIAQAQIKFLSRWLRRAPLEALVDFYVRAGLETDHPAAINPVDLERLQWGLAQLETVTVPPRLPLGWSAWCGAQDSLLDAKLIKTLVPETQIVAGATHHPAALLRAWNAASTTP